MHDWLVNLWPMLLSVAFERSVETRRLICSLPVRVLSVWQLSSVCLLVFHLNFQIALGLEEVFTSFYAGIAFLFDSIKCQFWLMLACLPNSV